MRGGGGRKVLKMNQRIKDKIVIKLKLPQSTYPILEREVIKKTH